MRTALDIIVLSITGALIWLWYIRVLPPELGGGLIGASAAVCWFIEWVCPRP